MKKFLSLFLALLLLLSLAACAQDQADSPKPPKDEEEADHFPAFLTDADWGYYDNGVGERMNITFTEDGEFYYCCDCGEPVGDSDIYESYTYSEKKDAIILKGYDFERKVLPIISRDDTTLVLEIDGEEITFCDYNKVPDPYE